MAEPGGKILVVTNDYPPRRGGIESFVFSLCAGLPAGELVVYTARMRGSDQIDGRVSYRVVRDRRRMLLPTRRLAKDVQRVAREHDCDRVVFGAAMPLGLLAAGLRAGGAQRIIGLTHGHEVWWSKVPGARSALRRVGRQVDVLTYVSDYCHARIARALRPVDAQSMVRLSPGVDPDAFAAAADATPLRRRLGIDDERPVVVAASRLVARKGHDVLVKAWPRVLAAHPRAMLLIVGDGPARRGLVRAVRRLALAASVRFVTDASWADMPAVYAAGDVFALPCRTRLLGLEPEALGIVFLEAAACGLPVIAGRSGGAPETVIDTVTGYVLDPRSVAQVSELVSKLLADPEAARAMGARGREHVAQRYSSEAAVATLRGLLVP